MIRVYVAAAFVAFFIFAYWAGWRIGHMQCDADVAKTTANINSQILTYGERVNDAVLKTGADDIRRILRTQYSIAE